MLICFSILSFLSTYFWVAPDIQNRRPEFELVIVWIGGAVGNKQTPPLLRARALLTATKLQRFLSNKYPDDIDKLLLISADAVGAEELPPVKVAAFKALSVFLTACPSEVNSNDFQFCVRRLQKTFNLFRSDSHRHIRNLLFTVLCTPVPILSEIRSRHDTRSFSKFG